ncbi:MFS transporter [Ktedonobacter sp. SOSP1-85]|uniref:MFS transporter n=1 Tax=Ktedonobacter sp. SOSP1-85 TaxID=2778367 RepID=UPI001916614A|nr:MFS transporter [Ktedonobacter sp. SOSP1-85]GHO81639.1 MFS transporter [Ktedonobacter sp. SOSP1-85]
MSLSPPQRLLIGSAFLGLFLFGFQSGAWGIILPDLMVFYHLTPATVGPFFVASALGYVCAVLSSGQMIEKWSIYHVMILGALILLLNTFILGMMPPLLIAIGAYGLIGLGTGLLDTSFTTMMAQFPRSATWLNLSQAGFGIGGLIGPLTAGILLTTHWRWNSIFFLLGGLCLPLLLLCGLARHLPRIAANTSHVVSDARSIQKQGHMLWLATLASPQVWLIGVFIASQAGLHGVLSSWLYSFALNERHLTPSFASILMSGFWISLLFARLFLHALAERFHLSRTNLIFACLGGITLGLVLFWLLPGGTGVVVFSLLVGLSEGPIYPTVISLVPHLVEKPLLVRSLSLMMTMNIVGVSLLPLSAGALIQQIGFWTVPLYLLGLTGIMLSIWWRLGRHDARGEAVKISSAENRVH